MLTGPFGRIWFQVFLWGCSGWDSSVSWQTEAIRLPFMGFPGGSAGKESTCNAGDLGLIPGSGRSPGEEKDYSLQYSGLENSMDCVVHGVTKSRRRRRDFHFQCVAGAHHLIGWRPDGKEGLTLPQRILPAASAGASALPVSTAASSPHAQTGTDDDYMRRFFIRIFFIYILLILFLWSPLTSAELTKYQVCGYLSCWELVPSPDVRGCDVQQSWAASAVASVIHALYPLLWCSDRARAGGPSARLVP